MLPLIKKSSRITDCENLVILASAPDQLDSEYFSIDEFEYLTKRFSKDKKDFFAFNRYSHVAFVIFLREPAEKHRDLEKWRKFGDQLAVHIKEFKLSKIVLTHTSDNCSALLAVAEGLALSCYQFLKYKNDKDDKELKFKEIAIRSKDLEDLSVQRLNILLQAVYKCRDLVNEPLSYLTAVKFSEELADFGKSSGLHVEVLSKLKIESLKMGGLLAVNKGTLEEPTFTIMEWKPDHAVNSKPIVFVGKGVVFDTGGLVIKPYEGMLTMKDDMAGAAAVACAVCAVAASKLPVHIVALIPATENRPDGNAFVPGDVITMYDGTTVEVLNTDAEGRLILADALAYAKKYEPELVIDMATLTGAASVAIGKQGMVGMHKDADSFLKALCSAGEQVHERVAVFPFWEEYGEMIKSDVADLKNLGGRDSGAITAGKFLAHFTDYPYIHLDIAGPAWLDKQDSYRSQGGTGVGVRLLFEFIRQYENFI
jgi:leucyl aminopeptidase